MTRFGDGEIDALADFFLRDISDPSAAQKKWLDENADIEKTVEGYLDALSVAARASGADGRSGRRYTRTLPLFPRLEASLRNGRIVLRNVGDFTLRTRTYGQPAYRVIVNGKWCELPCDLRPGEETEIPAPKGERITLVHGLQGIAVVDPTPFAELS